MNLELKLLRYIAYNGFTSVPEVLNYAVPANTTEDVTKALMAFDKLGLVEEYDDILYYITQKGLDWVSSQFKTSNEVPIAIKYREVDYLPDGSAF